MSDYTEFFLNGRSWDIELECIEIYHPSMTETIRIVRNATKGLTVTHEDGLSYFYTYYPLKVELSERANDLDNKMTIVVGDLGELIPLEIDRIRQADTFTTKPTFNYRLYSSSDLTSPMLGPLNLKIQTITMSKEGATMEIAAPSLNINKTGEYYSITRFPTLRGFL